MRDFLLKVCRRIMPSVRGLAFVSALALVVLAPVAFGQEIRTYEFVVGENYTFASDCGECSLVFGSRARVTGQFQVLLDVVSGTGVLQSLDVTLVDVEVSTTSIDGPPEWLPQPDRPFFIDPFVDSAHRPPLPGVLESVGNELLLSPNGVSVPSGGQFVLPQLFLVTLSGNDAEIDFFLPITEIVPRITGAQARLVAVVPEPSGLGLALTIAAISLLLRTKRML